MSIAVTVKSVGSIGAKKSYYEVRYCQRKIIVQMQEYDEDNTCLKANTVHDAARRMIESLPFVRYGEWVCGSVGNYTTVFCYRSTKENALWIS